MSKTKYIEFDSSFRDRSRWKKAAEFEIPVSQTGRKTASSAIDPVSLAASLLNWIPNTFDALSPSHKITVTVASVFIPGIGDSADQNNVIVTGIPGQLQIIDNYYNRAVAVSTSPTPDERSRIISYTYLGNDRAEFSLHEKFVTSLSPGDAIDIIDPTDISSIVEPTFFIPDGKSGDNAYSGFYLYNITRGQGRKIKYYENHLATLTIITNESLASNVLSGPITTWTLTDSYSIRKDPPLNCAALTGDIVNNPSTKSSFIKSASSSFSGLEGSFLQIDNTLSDTNRVGSLTTGGSGSVAISLTADSDDDFFSGCSIRMTSGTSSGQISIISAYNGISKFITLAPGFVTGTSAGDTYCITCPLEARRVVKYVSLSGIITGTGSNTSINLPASASNTNSDYNNLYIRITTGLAAGDIRLIRSYAITTSGGFITRTVTPYTQFSGVPVNGDLFEITSGIVDPPFRGSISTQLSCDLIFSYDNLNPFTFSGNTVAQQEMVSYEITLVNLILPNAALAVGGLGSRVIFYPYLYLEISNVSATSSGSTDSMYSNNPNASKALFRVIISDTTEPITSAFTNLNSYMKQTVKFKPNDTLFIKITLSSGEVFETTLVEMFSPHPPNALAQISGMLGITRIVC
jgi:hypothetical protein